MTTSTNDPRPPEEVDARAGAHAQQEAASPVTLATAAGLVGTLLAWLLRRWLRGRRQPSTGERALETVKSLGDTSLTQGRRIGEQVQSGARPAAERAGELARRGAKVGAAGAVVAAAKVMEAGSEVGSTVASTGAHVAEGAAAASGAVVDAAHDARKFGRRWTRRILFLVSLAVGYVLGAAAGRERYEQIVSAARSLADRPEVQRAKAKAQEAAADA